MSVHIEKMNEVDLKKVLQIKQAVSAIIRISSLAPNLIYSLQPYVVVSGNYYFLSKELYLRASVLQGWH